MIPDHLAFRVAVKLGVFETSLCAHADDGRGKSMRAAACQDWQQHCLQL